MRKVGLGRDRLCLVLHLELVLGSMGTPSDLCLCTSTMQHAGCPGILAVAKQRIEPAPHYGGSVLSACGLSGGLIPVFQQVLSAVRLERCRYLQLCYSS